MFATPPRMLKQMLIALSLCGSSQKGSTIEPPQIPLHTDLLHMVVYIHGHTHMHCVVLNLVTRLAWCGHTMLLPSSFISHYALLM